MSTYWSRLLPPYYKYSVFVFLGFLFVYCACLLAISEAYYKSASQILPIAYRMFDDTVAKGAPDFDWTAAEKTQMETYRHAMMTLWVFSTCGVVLSMLIIIPQFFDFNDKRGNPSHLCLVQIKLAWFLAFMVMVYVIILGGGILWAWIVSSSAVHSFYEHFEKCQKEEIFLTDIEKMWECISDDDKEVDVEHRCWQKVKTSMITPLWVDLLFYVYLAGIAIAFLAIPFFNKQLVKPDEEELDYIKSLDDEKPLKA